MDRRHGDGVLRRHRPGRAPPDRPGRPGPLLRPPPRLRPGYGPAVNRLLRLVREGGDWRELSAALFNGQGSWGNGAAMRIPPLGAWYADDPEQATHQAEISAYPTHQHREAVVGAMAVAAAAALAAAPDGPPGPEDLLDGVIALVPARSAVGAGCAGRATCSTTATRPPSRPSSAADGVRARTTPCLSRSGPPPGPSATTRPPSGRPRRWAGTSTPPAPSWAGWSRRAGGGAAGGMGGAGGAVAGVGDAGGRGLRSQH